MDKIKFAADSLVESAETKLKIKDACLESILKAVDLIVGLYRKGNKLLLCGNGGSAADCQHIATEFMIRLNHQLKRPPLCAIALTTDSSNLTAGANDIGFENVFARNVQGLGNKGDVLIAISTSGNSPNIIKAVSMAHEKGMQVIGFLGGAGGNLKTNVDIPVVVPSSNVQRIQEGHITIAHIICELVELELYGDQVK
ncbi:MAG: SIS domain-containing protein [Ignavibacteriaceae bacterium]|nr:SIS domain-containing protein [Ignavibacteriaceae bacterium]